MLIEHVTERALLHRNRYLSGGAAEQERIARVVERDGREEAKRWARRVAAAYRSAVLDPHHFAHSGEARRRFIEAYVELKRFIYH